MFSQLFVVIASQSIATCMPKLAAYMMEISRFAMDPKYCLVACKQLCSSFDTFCPFKTGLGMLIGAGVGRAVHACVLLYCYHLISLPEFVRKLFAEAEEEQKKVILMTSSLNPLPP